MTPPEPCPYCQHPLRVFDADNKWCENRECYALDRAAFRVRDGMVVDVPLPTCTECRVPSLCGAPLNIRPCEVPDILASGTVAESRRVTPPPDRPAATPRDAVQEHKHF